MTPRILRLDWPSLENLLWSRT